VALVLLFFVELQAGDLRNLRTRHPLLVESALLELKGSASTYWGVEFEEDSGDFPTTKFPWHLYWALGENLTVGAGAELVIFNQAGRTSSGGTNALVSALYQFTGSQGARPAVTYRQDLLPPTGGFSTGRWNTTSALLLSWVTRCWLFHVNGSYTFGGHDDRPISVSEVDRTRILFGAQYHPPGSRYSLLISFSGADPMRTKPYEPCIELGARYRLGSKWVVNGGIVRSLKDSAGPDYLIRTSLELAL
jgi:hypothetical protein